MIDAHHHLWDPAARDYPWMTGELAPMARRFSLNDLEGTLPPNVRHTIVVQASASLEETEELLAIAHASATIAGVVGWLDLRGDVPAQIARLRSAPGGEKLVGIRHQAHDEPSAQWLVRGDILDGLDALAGAGLVYEFLVRARELPAATEAARRVPNAQFVLDHGGKPNIARGGNGEWERCLRALAANENVACKLSGLVTEARWDEWRDEDVIPYARVLLEVFGPQRMVFGSDWPVCLLAGSYARVLNLAQRVCDVLTDDERDDVFANNARRIYRLPLETPNR